MNFKKYPRLMEVLSSDELPDVKDEAKAEPETKVVKNFRHKGQYYSIIEKDPGALKKKKYIFQIDGEDFTNEGKGWPSAQDTMTAIKQYVQSEFDRVTAEGEVPPAPAPKPEEGVTDALNQTDGEKAYEVHVAHDASIYCVVKLHADDEEDAEEKAFEMARNGELNWALSDGNPTDDPYLPNDESIEEIGGEGDESSEEE